MDEPSLLDYLKEKLNPRRLLRGEIDAVDEEKFQ